MRFAFNLTINPCVFFITLLLGLELKSILLSISLGSLERDIKNLEVHIQALDVNDLNNALIDLQIDRSLHNNYKALLRQHHNRCT